MAKELLTPDADEVIDRLRKVVHAGSDKALSEYFGLGTNATSNWRQRKRVPFAECVDTSMRVGVSLDWLLLGLGPGSVEPGGKTEPLVGEADPRVERMIGFILRWQITHDSDDVAWLERTLARTVPEYAEWLAAHMD